jgi:hypothetical protein
VRCPSHIAARHALSRVGVVSASVSVSPGDYLVDKLFYPSSLKDSFFDPTFAIRGVSRARCACEHAVRDRKCLRCRSQAYRTTSVPGSC